MKKLIIAAALMIAGWSAWWFIGKSLVTSGVESKITEYRDQGYTITHNDLGVRGYPLAYKVGAGPVTVIGPKDASGGAGASLKLDKADISAAAYRPTAWSLVHEGPAQFDIPVGPARWEFETLTEAAKIDIGARVTGGLSSLAVDAKDIQVTETGASAPPVKSLAAINYIFSRKGSGATYQLIAKDAAFTPGSLGKIGQALGYEMTNVSGGMDVAGYGSDTPRYTCDDFSVLWGKADMGGAFDLTRGPSGLSGKIDLTVANEQALISELTSKRILSSGEAMIGGLIIGGLPKTDAGRRKISLSVSGDNVSLGPIKLGRLPF